MSDARRPLVVVTVGTDHHRFDRLTAWVESWLRQHPSVRCVHQHGTSAAAAGARGVEMMSHDDLLALEADADVVVTQGGPGSILDARGLGIRPVVIPRRRALREVVDDHQLHFCRRIADEGWIFLVEDEATFADVMTALIAEPGAARVEAEPRGSSAAAHRIAGVLTELASSRSGFVKLGRIRLRRRPSSGVAAGGS